MKAYPKLCDAASAAEGIARNLNQAFAFEAWGCEEARNNAIENAIGYLRQVADLLGHELVAQTPVVEPPRTPEAVFTPWDYAANRGQM